MKLSLFLLSSMMLGMLTCSMYAMDRDEQTLLINSQNDTNFELIPIEKHNTRLTAIEEHTKIEYSEEFLNECKSKITMGTGFGGVIGVISGLAGLFGCMTTSCLFAIPAPASISLCLVGVPAIGALTGAALGAGYTCCCTKPEKRYTKTILKQIAQYPPIIEKLRKLTHPEPVN